MSVTSRGGETRRNVVLRRRAHGEPRPDDFAIVEEPVPEPGPGEVLTRTIWLSIDPYMRGRISDRASYATPVQLGETMIGESIREVVASQAPEFSVGDVVVGSSGWQTHSISKASALTSLDRTVKPLSVFLGVLGMPGVTAYSAMTDIAQVQPGETVVVSAASGPVGSVAGQLAKRAGARVVGVAGAPEKCLWVQETLGFDDCVDHRGMDLKAALAGACPKGIDVYVENVGGKVQEAALALLNTFARVPFIGMVAQYNEATFPPGPNLGFIVVKRARLQGILVTDKPERYAEWRALATPWLREGSLKYRETVMDGLDSAPEALATMLRGGNFGKMLVRVGPDPV